jgi:hypothetical protein
MPTGRPLYTAQFSDRQWLDLSLDLLKATQPKWGDRTTRRLAFFLREAFAYLPARGFSVMRAGKMNEEEWAHATEGLLLQMKPEHHLQLQVRDFIAFARKYVELIQEDHASTVAAIETHHARPLESEAR